MFPLCSNCVQADSWLTGADISQVFLLTAAFFSGEFFLSAGSLICFSVKKFAQRNFSPLKEKICWTENLPVPAIFAQTILKYATGIVCDHPENSD